MGAYALMSPRPNYERPGTNAGPDFLYASGVDTEEGCTDSALLQNECVPKIGIV